MKKLINALGILMVAAALFLIITFCGRGSKPSLDRDTVIIVSRDTIERIDTQYIAKTNTVVKPTLVRDTLIIQNDDTIAQKQYSDTICLDIDTVIAQSYISGRNAKLDSLSLQLKKAELTKEKTITDTITKTITKKQHFFWGPTVGVGYGVVNKKADVFIGVSVGYKF